MSGFMLPEALGQPGHELPRRSRPLGAKPLF
jgi:hypothetical protein